MATTDDPMTGHININMDNLGQLDVFHKAMETYLERTKAYGDVWRNYGAASNLLSAARKVDRLMKTWWDDLMQGKVPSIHKDALDDAVDAINYLAFFIRNVEAGNLSGTRPPLPSQHSHASSPVLGLRRWPDVNEG